MSEDQATEGRIAIVGMSGRFPGAATVHQFWRNLCDGVEGVRFFTQQELEDTFRPEIRNAPGFVAARPIVDDVDQFDSAFFGMHAREADLTDPQQRLFLECCWEAIEDAGHHPSQFPGPIGVFAGSSINTYFLHNLCHGRSDIERFTNTFQVGDYATLLGSGREFLATRVSYKLDLRGPSITVQTACSTSLVAVAQACQSLLMYQSDAALAGGVSISFPQKRGFVHQDGGMVTADGHCRPFDADASGTIFGDGCAVVMLKRLEDALADGNTIYAVILGCGVNNDGATKVGFTAPSVGGQAGAIEQALTQAGVSARDISYVECHGTATPLGDPIEIAGLNQAFRTATDDRGFCAIGSVKGNIGHLDAAAGVAGLIKTALMLKHRAWVPTLHYKAANPRIDFANSPFFVASSLSAWPDGPTPRRAGVSSLGVGGTNAHVVLEEPPPVSPRSASTAPQLIVLSARTPAALATMQTRLGGYVRAEPDLRLCDVAFTLQQSRSRFGERAALVGHDIPEVAQALADGTLTMKGAKTDEARAVAFMFPGQGAQYPGMASGIYDRFETFRTAFDRCAEIAADHGLRLLDVVQGPSDAEAARRLSMTQMAQPALFTVGYALARLWQSWGIQPASLVGHSVGEFVAACLAGVFSLEDALDLVITRGRMMQSLPAGAMTAVRLPEAEVQALLDPALSIAAVNGPSHCVIAGPGEAIEAAEQTMASSGVTFRRLHTSHAFHSAMMEPMIAPFAERISRVALSAPQIPYVSCVTGTWIEASQAMSVDYWARHARATVRFKPAIDTMISGAAPILLEVGPGTTLSTLVRQSGHRAPGAVLNSLPGVERQPGDEVTMLSALGWLFAQGADPDWDALADGGSRRIALPTYPFERRRHWVDPPARATAAPEGVQPSLSAPAPHIPPAMTDTHEMDTVATTMPASPLPGSAPLAAGRLAEVRETILSVLEATSGESVADAPAGTSFLELGFDSLLLSQVTQQLQSRLGVKIAFRQLLSDLATVDALAEAITGMLPPLPAASAPPEVQQPAPLTASAQPAVPTASQPVMATAVPAGAPAGIADIMRQQVEALSALMQSQLETLRQFGTMPQASAPVAAPPVAARQPETTRAEPVAPTAASRFQSYKPVQSTSSSGLTPEQQRHIETLTARLTAKTAGSKRLTAQYRTVLADPRAAAGFRPEWKELVYPVVCARSKGSRIWDVDGNEYIDLVNGYGPTAFGHAPDFVMEALRAQLDKGFATGPQSDLAGEVARLFTEITGNERMTFCNTGSEAVMAAMRISRAVTGRTKVVMFNGDYHGQFDEVLVRGMKRHDGTPRSAPAAAGIPPSAVENVVVLDYGAPASLDWIRANASDLAAVIVEPVQSRHPALRPFAFLHDLRTVTEQAGIAFIMDEIVTGFRVHPGGMQAVTGIRADLATYGKVIGGGMPIGILAGKAAWMDALDGGPWQYGDDSVPEVGVTFFAGTFVRHPMVLAAVKAVLDHLRSEGAALYDGPPRLAERLAESLNALFKRHRLAARAEHYASFLYFNLHADTPMAPLLFHHLRDRGIHVQDGFPIFLTTAHSEQDIDRVIQAFAGGLAEMAADGLLPAPISADMPLTESQMEIWLSAQMGDDASCAFNESVTMRFSGPLDEAALGAALAESVKRHDALRLRFSPTGETMHVPDEPSFDYAALDADEAALQRYITQDAATPFALSDATPMRARLFRLATDSHALVLTAHHIVCDGWSINVLVREIAERYAARLQGRDADLPPVLLFSDYARAQAEQPAETRAAAEQYWLGQYETVPQPIDLPTDRLRPAFKTYAGATQSRLIDAALYRSVKSAAARNGCTLFVALLTTFQTLMARLSGAEDIVVGVPTAGQSSVEDKVLVGHCVNFLPIRAQVDGARPFADQMRLVAKQVLDAYEHQDYTLGTLVRKLAPERTANRLPLTEIQFNLERLENRLDFGGLQIGLQPNAKARVNFDLFCNIIESDDGLRIDCDYNTDLFDAATLDRWLGYYEQLLRSAVAEPVTQIAQMAIMPPDEYRLLVRDLNDTARTENLDHCVHRLIEASAAARPGAAAAIFGHQTVTYGALDQRSNRIANHLLSRIGSPGSRVGVLIQRSTDLLATLVAIWKAGCTYVPLDPGHPAERLRQILADADIAALISDGSHDGIAGPNTTVIDLMQQSQAIQAASAASPALPAAPDSPAYLIYTSGSTGKPKGVEVSHRSLANLLLSMIDKPGIAETDRLLAVTTIAFDIAALELFAPLVAGGTVIIADRETIADGSLLLSQMQDNAITVMQATPATWRLLVEAGFRSQPGFKMLCGGEPLPLVLAQQLTAGGGALWNMYGPTETTVWSACARISGDETLISIGGPIANTQMHILDDALQLAPPGVIGELFIGGAGVAEGYFGRDDLTAERFVPDPFGMSKRLYRTGDYARRSASGAIELIGRRDNQIKLRGFRIELGEIESVLMRDPSLANAAVILRADATGSPCLVAYIVERPGSPVSDETLGRLVGSVLPDYMVPTFWVRLDRLPLSVNGKLDRSALPVPSRPSVEVVAAEESLTPTESAIASIWCEVLQIDQVSRDADLLTLGADSIHLFQIAARANRQGLKLSARQLLEQRTIANLAALLDRSAPGQASPQYSAKVNVLRTTSGTAA